MYPYWLLFGLFALGGLLSGVDPRRDKASGMLVFAAIILTLMIGLRWQVGPDWYSYFRWWREAGHWSLGRFLKTTEADPGFYLLMWCFEQIGAPFWLFNLVVAAVFATGLVAFARQQANPWLAIAVSVPYLAIVIAMSGMRQATAIGFVLLAFIAFQRHDARKFLLYVALAASFHASSILLVPLVGLSFTRSRLQSGLLVLIAAVLAYFLLGAAFGIYSQRYLARTVQSSGTLFRLGMNALPALIFLTFRNSFPIEDREALLWRNMALAALASLIVFFFVSSTTALDRLVLYFFPLQIFVFGWLPWLIKRQAERYVAVLLLLFYLAMQLFVFLNFGVNKDAFIPYRTIFSREL